MNLQAGLVLGSLLLFLAHAPLQAKGPLQLKWSDAGQLTGRTIELHYADGATITGRATSFENGALILQVEKTSDAAAHPTGRLAVENGSFQTMRARRNGSKGRVIGSIVGVLGGIMVAGAIAVHHAFDSDANGAVAGTVSIGSLVGITIAGYFAGRSIDRRWEAVTIVP